VTPSLTTALTLLPPHLLLFLIPGPRPPRPPRPPTTPSLTPSRTRLSTLSPSQAVPSCVRPETCPHPQPCTGPSPFLLPISHWPQKTMPPAFPELGIDLMSNPCPSTLFHTKNPTVLRLLGSFEYDVCGRSLRWQPRSPPPLICALCLPTTDVSPPPSPHPLHSLPSGLPCPRRVSLSTFQEWLTAILRPPSIIRAHPIWMSSALSEIPAVFGVTGRQV